MHRLKALAAIGFFVAAHAALAQAPQEADDASALSCADFNAAANSATTRLVDLVQKS